MAQQQPPGVPLRIGVKPDPVASGATVQLTVRGAQAGRDEAVYWEAGGQGNFEVTDPDRVFIDAATGDEVAVTRRFTVRWSANDVAPTTWVKFRAWLQPGPGPIAPNALRALGAAQVQARVNHPRADGTVRIAEAPPPAVYPVTLQRASNPPTDDQTLWMLIRQTTEQLGYANYERFLDSVFQPQPQGNVKGRFRSPHNVPPINMSLPFPDVDAYRVLKGATEVFMQVNAGVLVDVGGGTRYPFDLEPGEEALRLYRRPTTAEVDTIWGDYLEALPHDPGILTLPYLELVSQNLRGAGVLGPAGNGSELLVDTCRMILREKLTNPYLLELVWSLWHEEGMLDQTMKAIAWRFQNRSGPGDRDPLALLEIDPLRPLNNLIWGWIQDEQHRLTVARRSAEYDHHYGCTLLGKAVPTMRPADPRPRFIEAFHTLLYLCAIFFKEDDDTTVVADGFPILNALRDVHLLLTQGAHNQYGDLPWTARQEMLMEQWLLARPEFREYLPRRVMVDYPEAWMQSVETMKTLQGWTDTSVLHFRDLGVFGERILLSVRFRDWTGEIHPESAANWARYWRAEIQGYIHAYRAVAGVDLTDHPDPTMPALLLRDRLQQRTTRRAVAAPGRRALPGAAQGRLAPAPQPARMELPEWTERRP